VKPQIVLLEPPCDDRLILGTRRIGSVPSHKGGGRLEKVALGEVVHPR